MKKCLLWCMFFLSLGMTAQTTITIGAGATSPTTYYAYDPIYRATAASTIHYAKSVQLLTQTDLTTVPVGSMINALGYYKTTAYNVSGSNSWTLNVYLKNANTTTLSAGSTWNTMKNGATLFFTENVTNTSSTITAAVGWVNLSNNTGNTFNYAGGAIEVYIEWGPTVGVTQSTPFFGGGFFWKYDATTPMQAMGTTSSAAIVDNYSAWSSAARRYQTQLTYTASTCTGAAPGNTLSSIVPSCPGTYTTALSLQNTNLGTGTTYQWYKNGTAITGATMPIYYETVTAADTYYCAVTCSGTTMNSNPVTVATPLSSVTTISENFDAYTASSSTHPDCWSKVGTLGSNYLVTTYFSSTNNSLYFFSASTTSQAVERLPNVSNLGAGTHRLRFKMRTSGTTTGSVMQLGYLTNPADASSFVPLNSVTNMSTSVTGFQEYIMAPPSGIYTDYIAIRNRGDISAAIYIDDLYWEAIPACSEPSTTIVTNTTSNSLTVSWTAASTAPSNGYEIYYATTNNAPTSSTTPQVTGISGASTSGVIPGLTGGTLYYIWVRSNCGASGTSSWTPVVTGSTRCNSVTTFTENFDSYTAGSTVHPTCWAKVGTGGSNYITSTTGYANSAPNCLYFYSSSTSSLAIEQLTPVSNLGAGTHRLRFKMRTTAAAIGSVIELGYLTNPLDPATFTALGSVTNTSTSTTGAQDYYIVPPAGVYTDFIAIKHTGTTAAVILIDDLSWEALPTCTEPTNVSTTTVTSGTANITWTPPATVPTNGYEVYVSTSPTPPTSATTATNTGITGTTYTVPNLNPSSGYYLWMRSVCSSTSNSAWSQVPYIFFTPCQPPAVLSTTGATVCSNQTANLSATAESGASLSWYNAATNGTLVGTGSSYTTPVLTATTDYWVTASMLSNGVLGKITPTSTTGSSGFSDVGLMFNVFKEMTINSVDVYPYSASAVSGSVTIALKNSAGTILNSTTATVNVNATGLLNTIPLNFIVPPGMDYRLVVTAGSGFSNLIRESSTGYTYPYTLTGFGSITSAYLGGASSATYNFLYNWQVSSTCESARTQVTATVSCLGTSEASAKENLTVYPNPFTDVINISNTENVKNVLVTDIAGRLVKTVPNPSSTLHFGDLKQGAYLFILELKDGSRKTIKAIKK